MGGAALKAGPSGRTLALLVVGLAATLGVASRIGLEARRDPIPRSEPAPALSIGQAIGDAVVEGLPDDDDPAIRLRAGTCAEPVYAAPFLLTLVAIPEQADRAHADKPGYVRFDVYDGRIRPDFSRLAKLFARARLKSYNEKAGFYVRFYAPAACAIPEREFVALANEILKTAPLTTDGED